MSHPVPPDLEKSDGERLGDSSRVVDDEEEEPRSLLARPGRFVAVFRPSTFLAALSFRFAFLRFAPKEGATGTMPAIGRLHRRQHWVHPIPPLSKSKRNSKTKLKHGVKGTARSSEGARRGDIHDSSKNGQHGLRFLRLTHTASSQRVTRGVSDVAKSPA